jgi:hypothetical protein
MRSADTACGPDRKREIRVAVSHYLLEWGGKR